MTAIVPCSIRLPEKTAKIVSPKLFSCNLEITRKGCWRGLAAEMVSNRKFAAVGKNGFPLHWAAAGDGAAAELCTSDGYAGTQCIRIDQRFPGRNVGIVQQETMLDLQSGREYEIRLAVKTSRQMQIVLQLAEVKETGAEVFYTQWDVSSDAWQLKTARFLSRSSGQVRLEIVSKTEGTFFIGAVSLTPADAFHGMRRDVVDTLKKLHPAVLRYPGGCYAEFYRWREALLPVDQRPPIGPTGLWFLLPDSDDYDTHEIGILEFLALCKEINAEPAITARMNESTPEDAAELVEFCNGSAETHWGALRIKAGGADWPRVRTWFIGNELWSFGHGPLKQAESCGEQTARFAEAMRTKDPDLQLIGCSCYDKLDWNSALVRQAGAQLDGYSLHCYLNDRFNGRLKDIAHAAETVLEPLMQSVCEQFRLLVPSDRPHTILFDEWNLHWGKPGSVAMGVYAASVLHLLCKKADSFDISQAFFFMAINEGIVDAASDPAKLDIAGIIFDLCRKHAGRQLLETVVHAHSDDVDLCATSEPAGSELCVTLLNRNVSETFVMELSLPVGYEGKNCSFTRWEPLFPDGNSASCRLHTETLTVDARGVIRFDLPPAAFASIKTE